MSDSAGDHAPGGPAADEARIEGENIGAAGAGMPGMQGALRRGSLDHASVDPDLVQGDEHRDPPAAAPTPPEPGDSARVRSVPDPVKPS